MTRTQKELIRMMASAIVNAYDANGNLVENYYNNIILQDLTKKDFIELQKIADGVLLWKKNESNPPS